MRWPIHRGQWRPLIPERWRTAVVGIIPLSPVIVGVDYVLGEATPALSAVEKAMPIDVWGWLLILAGAVTICGYVGRWRHVAIVGLHSTGALMVTLAVGIGAEGIGVAGGFRVGWLYAAVGLAAWGAAIGYAAQIEEGTRRGH